MTGISIHAAREGGDSVAKECLQEVNKFQSTPPVKAATKAATPQKEGVYISIHAAREGGDEPPVTSKQLPFVFQSTPPVKAATAETNRRNQHFRKQQV